MKISVCGKGGSGKSTVVALLAGEAVRRGWRVLVVDADESNSGLYRMLGFDHAPWPLMESLGGKKGLKEKMSGPSIFAASEIPLDNIPPENILQKNGLRLVSIGKILQSLEGCACPMGVLSREFLKKLSLKENEIVIVDMEAGIEHFGRGVETSLDSVLTVVEPSFESLELSARVAGLASGSGIKNVWAILNKVPSEEIASRLEAELVKRGLEVVGGIHQDPEVFKASLEGSVIRSSRVAGEVGIVLSRILGKKT